MKKKTISVLAVGLIFLMASTTVWAISSPVIQGFVAGIELCPEFICGAAYFVGNYDGQLGNNLNAHGTISTAIIHNDLPPANGDAAITGGVWELQTLTRRVRGVVAEGNIHNNNDDGTFSIEATLVITRGGSGSVTFQGTLSHNTLIPTFWGTLSQ